MSIDRDIQSMFGAIEGKYLLMQKAKWRPEEEAKFRYLQMPYRLVHNNYPDGQKFTIYTKEAMRLTKSEAADLIENSKELQPDPELPEYGTFEAIPEQQVLSMNLHEDTTISKEEFPDWRYPTDLPTSRA